VCDDVVTIDPILSNVSNSTFTSFSTKTHISVPCYTTYNSTRYIMIVFSLFTYSLKAWGQLRNHHNYINTEHLQQYSKEIIIIIIRHNYSSIDMSRPCKILYSKAFQVYLVRLVYNWASYVASCCCSLLLHVVKQQIMMMIHYWLECWFISVVAKCKHRLSRKSDKYSVTTINKDKPKARRKVKSNKALQLI
jgi:hypothetical protein